MLGMEMMLKSLGLDPEEIRKGITEFGQVIVDMKSQLDRIESKLNAVLAENATEETAQLDYDNSHMKDIENAG